MTLVHLFTSFFTIGLFSFGGGYAVISFLQQEVERRGWMSAEQFVDFIAISQSTPGPIAINMATFTGYQAGGLAGALAATVAVSLPGMILIISLALFFFHFYERSTVQALFQGLRPAVAGLIAAAAWEIAGVSIFNWTTAAITSVSVLLIARCNVHPIVLVIGSAMAGIILL